MSELLVIEDSPSIALLLRRRLEMAGHSVTVAANGTVALVWLEQEGLPELVLSDVTLPGIDGIETARRIKSEHPALPVILVTARDFTKPPLHEVDAVFAKPIDFDRLLETIERLVPGDLDPDP